MGVDHPRGPGRGPETADKVPSQGTRDQSSADPTGDKQQTFGDRSIETGSDTKKDPEADKSYVGTQLTEEPDETADPARAGNGGLEAEKPGQAEAEDPREDEGERVNDSRGPGTGLPEAGGAKDQDDRTKEPRPQDSGSSADDKIDDPEAPQQPNSLSTDNEAPPKPFSRLESLARAREAQLQNAEQLRAIFQDAQTADGDREAPPQSENVGGDEREPEAQPPTAEAPGGTDEDTGEPPAEPAADPPPPAEGQGFDEEDKPQPGPEVGRSVEKAAAPPEETGENSAPPEAQGDQGGDSGMDAEGDGTGEGAASKPTRLEGRRDYVVDDPAVPGRTITDIDCIEDGVLWEEKSATNAGDIGRWVAKHIDKKFSSYLDARQYMVDYEQAPIGFRFTSPGADPSFRSEVESAVERLRQANPNEQIMLEWS